MSRSNYDIKLEFSESKCIATYFVKSANLAGHTFLVLEGKGIAPNGEDCLVFDFMQQAKAKQLAQDEEKNIKSIADTLEEIKRDLINSESLREATGSLLSILRTGSFGAVLRAFVTIVSESKALSMFLGAALKTTSETAASSVLSLFSQDVGVIRSSHPTQSTNPLQKIRPWECTPSLGDSFHCFRVSRTEIDILIQKIRAEEPKPRPFQFFGVQLGLWGGSNCMDWTLGKLKLLSPCAEIVTTAWRNSGTVATPHSVCSALKIASTSVPSRRSSLSVFEENSSSSSSSTSSASSSSSSSSQSPSSTF